MKMIFSVAFTSRKPEVENVVHVGVVSVMPNLGGILIQTEDRNDIQIPWEEMTYGVTLEFHNISEDEIESGVTRIGRNIYNVINHCK